MKRLVILLMVMSFGAIASAGGGIWIGSGFLDNDLWSDPNNWEHGVPTSGDGAYLVYEWTGDTHGPLIDAGTTAVCNDLIISWNNAAAGTVTMNMTGGTLDAAGDIYIGLDQAPAEPNSPGVFNISGGDVTLLTAGKHMILGWGHPATVNQTGGTVEVSRLVLDWQGLQGPDEPGLYNLHDGVLTVNELLFIWPMGFMDIEAGTMIVDGDISVDMDIHIASGAITAYGGKGLVAYDYNISNALKTTVTAIPCPDMDFTGDCIVNLADFAVFSAEWLVEY